MKRKRIACYIMSMVIAVASVPGQTIWAEETDFEVVAEENQSGDGSELTDEAENVSSVADENSEELQQEESENSETGSVSFSDFTEERDRENETDTIEFSDAATANSNDDEYCELNKSLNMKSISYAYGSDCKLKIKVPDNGRIKVRGNNITQIDDALGLGFTVYWKENEGLYRAHRSNIKSLESFDSNYITVKPGEYVIRIKLGSTNVINQEATLEIVYQRYDEYVGEIEDNNSYDTANVLQNGIVYQGDYSVAYFEDDDPDIFTFNMEKPGKAEIEYKYSGDDRGYYTLFREDENENVYQISKKYNNGNYWRLPGGKYYIKISPISRSVDEYAYELKWTATYEAEDSYEIERNDLQSTANMKKVNQWYIGNINDLYEDSKDTDWFRFDIPKKSYISAEMKTKREASAKLISMSLFNNNTLMETDYNTNNPYLKTKTYLVNPGTYYIRMLGSDYENISWDYSVRLFQEDYIDIQSIEIPAEMKLQPNQSVMLSAVITPENASEKELEWSSDDEDVVSVDNAGNITAHGVGSANITACAKSNPEIEAICAVTVLANKPVSINKKSLNMTVGQSYSLKLTNATKPVWRSSNAKIVSVAQNGKITAKGLGKAVITGIYKGKKYTCTVYVNLSQQAITSLSSSKAGTLYVKWKKDNGAKGYQIQYSLNSKMRSGVKTVTISGKNSISKTVSRLQRGKRYYFRVRTYGRSNGRTVYGKWSTIRSSVTRK